MTELEHPFKSTGPRVLGRNSDNVGRNISPFPKPDTSKFVALSISLGRDKYVTGREQWELHEEKGLKRTIVIEAESSLFASIVHANPQVLNLKRDEKAWQIYPRISCDVEVKAGKLHATAFHELPLLDGEAISRDTQIKHATLQVTRRALGMGYAEGMRIIQETTSANRGGDYLPLCTEALHWHYAETHSDLDYWWFFDTSKFSQEDPAMGQQFDCEADEPREGQPMPVSDVLRAAFPESAAALDQQEAERKPWSAIKAAKPSAQEMSALGHFKRELKAMDPTTEKNIGTHVVNALGCGLLESISKTGIEATCEALQLYLDNYQPQEATAVTEATEAPAMTLEDHQTKVAGILNEGFPGEDGPVKAQHFYKATGFSRVKDALNAKDGITASLMYRMLEDYIRNAKQAPSSPAVEPSAPETPANTNTAPVAPAVKAEAAPMSIVSAPQNSLAPLPIVAQWDIMRQQAQVLIKSGFLPQSVKTPEQAITIMMMGQALGIEPIVALNTINVIQGKPTVSPQLMLALVRRSGMLESFSSTDDGDTCTVKMTRKGEAEHIETFSHDDAVKMGLANKDNWRKQEPVMRRWRAISAACRIVFPDVTWGIASYTTEEIDPDFEIVDAA